MNSQLFTKIILASLVLCGSVSARAGVLDRIKTANLTTQQGHPVNFGDGFFQLKDLASSDPVTLLLQSNFDLKNRPANETVYVGRAHYALNTDADHLNLEFFEDVRTFAYLLGPSNRLKLISTNPYRLESTKSVMLGITVSSQQTIRVVEADELQADSTLAAVVQRLSTRNVLPTRVVMQSFNQFDQYFDVGVMFTMIYADGSGKSSIDLANVSLAHSIPPLIGRNFISVTSKSDLFYYVDHLSTLGSR